MPKPKKASVEGSGTLMILISPDHLPDVVGIGWVIHNLEIASERAAVNDTQFEIAELQDRAVHIIGRVGDRINAVAVLEAGPARVIVFNKKGHSLTRECPVKVCNRLFISCLI